MKLGWYLSRLRLMSAAEVAARVGVAARQRYWSVERLRPDGIGSLLPGERAARVSLPRGAAPGEGLAGAREVVAAADGLLAGEWPLFDLRPAPVGAVPDWFRDPLTGRVSSPDAYAFDVPYRQEPQVGNVKYLWEMSRHQATTVLASAWWITGEDRYADRVREHLTSWWDANPFLAGVHWTSGIEVGIRLLSWTWIRALLADWSSVHDLFDGNDVFAGQVYHHLTYLRALHSRGSSANNHLVAELAGCVAACAAFPWFAESAEWGEWATAGLAEAAAAQTHADGFNREQASEYHLFVFELLAGAALAMRLAGQAVPRPLDDTMRGMSDALAASLDGAGRPPRFGDGDDGRGVLLDAPRTSSVEAVLDVGRSLFGAAPWWPPSAGTVLGHVAQAVVGTPAAPRAAPRPDVFAGVGMTILRDEQLWVRCDAGPHGYLSIGAHGHADALSIEVRAGGTEILADPGTYCYHGEPEWRGYFKGTLGHNTLRIDGRDQARSHGPFLWLDHPEAAVAAIALEGTVKRWQASHDGYRRLGSPAVHHRAVALDTGQRSLHIEDWIVSAASHAVDLVFHLGPEIRVVLEGAVATLRWSGGEALMRLPVSLEWRVAAGAVSPPLGWYSRGFGQKMPSSTLVGSGVLAPAATLETELHFHAH
jgi:hypothetical protein